MKTEAQIREMLNSYADKLNRAAWWDESEATLSGVAEALKWVLGEESEVGKPEAETEIYYTGGNIFCAVHKLADGTWFSGATNEYGGVYKTRDAAIESFAEDRDFVRYVEDREEQLSIWREVYAYGIKNGEYADECREWLETLESDIDSF